MGRRGKNQTDAPRVACLSKPILPRSFKGDNKSSPGLARHHGTGLRRCLWLLAGQGRTARPFLRRVPGGDQEGFPAALSCVSPRLQEQPGELMGWLLHTAMERSREEAKQHAAAMVQEKWHHRGTGEMGFWCG